MYSMKNVLVVGSTNMDLSIQVHRIPQIGETVTGKNFNIAPGGKGENQAVAAARLGCNTTMIGAVGNDLYGETILAFLKEQHVDISGMNKINANTGIAMIMVCGGDNFIILDKGANAYLTSDIIVGNKKLVEAADVIVLQFEIPMETILYTAKLAKKLNKFVIINPSPVVDIPKELYAYTDMLIPNQHEAEAILNIKMDQNQSESEAIHQFLKLGVKYPVITLGNRGCIYFDGQEIKRTAAYKVKAVDSTGAGDSFIGGICKGICSNVSMSETIAYATKVSAITVTKKGAAPSFPVCEDVEQFNAT